MTVAARAPSWEFLSRAQRAREVEVFLWKLRPGPAGERYAAPCPVCGAFMTEGVRHLLLVHAVSGARA